MSDAAREILVLTKNDEEPTRFTVIALTFRLALMMSAPFALGGFANTSDTSRPAHLAHTLVALRVVYRIVDFEHFRSIL
jgi:hypothetical protein